jgi:GDP-4-dehydro-6-deoxy-D-mannose reductase
MRVLITGAGGFVGKHLIEALSRKPDYEIYATAFDEKEAANIELPDERITRIDITDKQAVDRLFERVQPEQVYHLAAQSSVGLSWKIPAVTLRVNIEGTLNLLEAMRSPSLSGSRILLIGSAEQYGKVSADHLPIQEEQPVVAANPYAISKIAQEQLAAIYKDAYGISVCIVRAFNHIGTGQRPDFVISDWAHQIVEIEQGKRDPVLYVGNIKVKRDFTDVRDIVRAYNLIMEKGESGEIYNVGSGKSISLEVLLQTMISLSSRKDISIQVDPAKMRAADIEELVADNRKLVEGTGWEKTISLEQTLSDILDSLRKEN